MKDDSFVKIENKKMPMCNFNYPDLDESNTSNAGFTNMFFLAGIVATFFMWIVLIFFRR